ncbi:cache domain-containing protein, partial [Campylobacter canadensis]
MKISFKIGVYAFLSMLIITLSAIFISLYGFKGLNQEMKDTTNEIAVNNAKATARSVSTMAYYMGYKIHDSMLSFNFSSKDYEEQILNAIDKLDLKNKTTTLFIIDSKGTYKAHYINGRVGTNAIDKKDMNNKFYIKEIIQTAKNGGGYVTSHMKADKTRPERDVVYFALADKNVDLIYVATVNLLDAQAIVTEAQNDFNKIINKTLLIFASITCVITIILLFGWAFFIKLNLSNPLNALTNKSIELSSGDGDLTKKLEVKGKD